MSKIALVLRELHRSENNLARNVLVVADRHRVEHEIFHTARDIAQWSQEHIREIAECGQTYGLELDHDPSAGAPVVIEHVVQRAGVLIGSRSEPGLLLLADLRRLHRKATGVSLDWELLAQAAQAIRKRDLLDLAQHCHPQTLRQMKWANAQLKIISSQVLAS